MRTILNRRTVQVEEKRVMNTEEAARYLGVGKCVFRQIIASGELPYKMAGRIRLFSRDALEKWSRFEREEAKSGK